MTQLDDVVDLEYFIILATNSIFLTKVEEETSMDTQVEMG
jgi:hypothetical protein